MTPEQLAKRREQLAHPSVARIIKWGAKANVALFRATNGRIGATWRIGAGWRKPVPVLLLDHIGRRSGQHFTTPLLYLEHGEDLVVVASQGGLPKNPQWFHNLVATPGTEVHVPRRGRHPVLARVADDAERARLWPLLVDLYADYDTYQQTTDRVIPVVVLAPR